MARPTQHKAKKLDSLNVKDSTVATGRRRSGTDTRQLLLSSARELVAETGFREAQMSAVAARAGIAIGTVYRYFPAKTDLMAEIVALASQREVDVAAGIAMGEGTGCERLSSAIWTFALRALAGRRMAHALIAEPVEAEIEAARLKYRRKLARVFETIIEQGIREGNFVSQNVQAAAACIVGSIFEGLIGPLAADATTTDSERRENAAAITAFCLRGVSGTPATFAAP
ncbi:TetR/AcrR family transcriptional regulator [Sphingomonas mali]|uniref:TetR/AcrR family transcriptional regulator n=1 Tax=Sphingomonas mali TaxID=40682 RepID=UPI000A06ECCA|nr:TetR/AcrR family transcriptional regulator [Sphingomonas mali]